MSSSPQHVHELIEYQPLELHKGALSHADAERLHSERNRKIVDIQYPTTLTRNQWRLNALGWIGYLPVSPTLALRIAPKVPLGNVFRMLELAYDLSRFRLYDELVDCRSLEDFFDRLAHVLSRSVLARLHRGLHREYRGCEEELGFIRGRIDLRRALRRPASVALPCRFEEHDAEIVDNRILAWTLERIGRSGLCRPEVVQSVRRACRGLRPIPLAPVTARDCTGRTYSRLNQDYRPMHALCRFFLENTGPGHEAGDRASHAFLVDMASLFETFVARWLQKHRPDFQIAAQKTCSPAAGRLTFRIDLVIHDRDGAPRTVLDTKYKRAAKASSDDVAQVVCYAELMGCTDAVLLYPEPPAEPLDLHIGRIRVRTLAFDLGGELEPSGRELIAALSG